MRKIIFGIFAFVIGLALVSVVNPSYAATETVYDALPSVDPATNYPSQPFQAQQTFEFGDYIHLGGTARTLNSVTVTMSDWAKFSDYIGDIGYSDNSTSWTHPITLNIYTNSLDANGAPDDKIATVTQDITIPWRPESDPNCNPTSNGTGWSVNNVCFNYSGIAFNATFDLSSLNVELPDDIIVSVAYNTQTWGYAPIGSNGPYNSLNVAVPPSQIVNVGSDNDTDAVFWNTATCSYYSIPGVCNILREDTNWTPWGTVAIQIIADPELVGPPTNKDECKKDGWKTFNNPTFKNQGACVSYVQANENAEKQN